MTKHMTAEVAREILIYEPETGLFRWRVDRGNGHRANDLAGRMNSDGYWVIINGDRCDNRWANLRLVSRVENSQNRHSVSRKKANKLIGAYFIGSRAKPWRAAIKVMGKLMNLGQFATEQEAHAVYLDAKRIYHPAFVRPNGG